MKGSYLNDPCRELRSSEPSLVAQDRAEDLLCEFVADHPPQDLVIRLARHLEVFAAERMDAAKVYASAPWLSDVAEALGMVRPCDGAPLALNWTQALAEIRDLHEWHVAVDKALRRWRSECPCACAACAAVEQSTLPKRRAQ